MRDSLIVLISAMVSWAWSSCPSLNFMAKISLTRLVIFWGVGFWIEREAASTASVSERIAISGDLAGAPPYRKSASLRVSLEDCSVICSLALL